MDRHMTGPGEPVSQERLDLDVETDLISLVRGLTELTECIRRAIDECERARQRSALMGLDEITHELDFGRLRLVRARQVLDRSLSPDGSGLSPA